MKSIALPVLLILLVACSSNPKLNSNQKKAMLFYNQGTQELQDGEYTKALRHLLQANKYSPKDSQILNNLGMAYYFKKSYNKATTLIKESLEIDPNNSEARTNLGTLYLGLGKYKLAEKHYQEVLKDLTYLYQFRTHYNLGIIAAKLKQSKKAMKHFRLSVAENENYCPANYQLGNLYFQDKLYEEALEKYKKSSFGTCFEKPEPHYAQALSHIKLEQFEIAKQKLNDIIERFSLTPYSKTAKRQLENIVKLERRLILDNENRLFKGGNKSPDF